MVLPSTQNFEPHYVMLIFRFLDGLGIGYNIGFGRSGDIGYANH